MSTLVDTARHVYHQSGLLVIQMESGVEIRFPVANNPRLSRGTDAQLNHVEVSPLGLHWPELDEDLSFGGLLRGNFGQARVSGSAEGLKR